MDYEFKPRPQIKFRFILLVVLLLPLVLSSSNWGSKLGYAVVITGLVGSFREWEIRDGKLIRRYVIAFRQFHEQSWKLKRFVMIEVDTEPSAGWGVLILLGPLQWVFCRIFDWLFSWFGGFYQIKLRLYGGDGPIEDGDTVLAWQGSSDRFFEENLDHLQQATQLETRRSGT